MDKLHEPACKRRIICNCHLQRPHDAGADYGVCCRAAAAAHHERPASLDDGRGRGPDRHRAGFPGPDSLHVEGFMGAVSGSLCNFGSRPATGLAAAFPSGAYHFHCRTRLVQSVQQLYPDGPGRPAGGFFQRLPGYRHRRLPSGNPGRR